MFELNRIYNEDCFITMDTMVKNNVTVDLILTSPPYNTGRNNCNDIYATRYDVYTENKDFDDYADWTVQLFNYYNKILKNNGCVLYNISYGSENNEQLWTVLSEIIKNTEFTVADMLIWHKSNALPNNQSSNKLTRICEPVFVLCRKSEYKTFHMNKKVKSISNKGQKFYENINNYIKAVNNDGQCEFNHATYSSDLCVKLLNIYAPPHSIVYDSFMGTGTTAVACKCLSLSFIGSEISEKQCEFANNRLLYGDSIYNKTNSNNKSIKLF